MSWCFMPDITGDLVDQFWQCNWGLVTEEDESEFISIYSQIELLQYYRKVVNVLAMLPRNLKVWCNSGLENLNPVQFSYAREIFFSIL